MDFFDDFLDFVDGFSHKLGDLRFVGEFGEASDKVTVNYAFSGEVVASESAMVASNERGAEGVAHVALEA